MMTPLKTDILCSFIIPTRNDRYAGNSPDNLARNVNYLISGLRNSAHKFEIVIVEWNFDPDRDPLKVSLNGKLEISLNVKVRVISVPMCVHRSYRYWRSVPYCPVGAVNFGIRRVGSGKFCVVKFQDTFYSKQLIEWFCRGEIDPNSIYRADRFVTEITQHITVPEKLNEYELMNNGSRDKKLHVAALHTNACGDFMLMPTEHWFALRGWCDSGSVRMYGADGLTLAKAVGYGLLEKRLPANMVVFKPKHNQMYVERNTTKTAVDMNNEIFVSVASLLKRVWGGRLVGRLLRWAIYVLFNLPRNKDGCVPVDSIYRYHFKYNLRLCLSKYIKFGRKDWGFPKIDVIPVDLN